MKRTLSEKLAKQGIAACKAGQVQDAQRFLLQALELDQDNETAWLWLSAVVDSLSERRRCLENVLRISPHNTHARAGLAWLDQRSSLGRRDSTVRPDPNVTDKESCPFCAKPLLAHDTVCRHCQRALIVTCPTCGKQLDVELTACTSCGHRLGDYRQGVVYYAALGNAYLGSLKADLAISAWQQVLEIDDSYPDAFLRLGEAQMLAGDWEEARSSFQSAVDKAPDKAVAYTALGRVFEQRQRWDEARKAYEQAVAADTSSAASQFTLGRLLVEGQALKAAFPHVLQATKLDREHAGAWFLLGQLYELAHEPRKAVKAYEGATALADRTFSDHAEWCKRAGERLALLRPTLPLSVTLNWPETIRQTAGMFLIPAVAALVNAGLRPWEIAPTEYFAVLLATLGAYFWVSASAMPRNPGMRAMLGQDGLSQPILRATVGVLGALFWVMGLMYVLLAPALTGTAVTG